MRKSQRKPKVVPATIRDDGEIPEWMPADFKRARPAARVVPEIVAEYRRGRGPQKTPTKKLVSLRLSQEVLDHFKATGPGWQTRIDKALKKVVGDRRVGWDINPQQSYPPLHSCNGQTALKRVKYPGRNFT